MLASYCPSTETLPASTVDARFSVPSCQTVDGKENNVAEVLKTSDGQNFVSAYCELALFLAAPYKIITPWL
jgi:hypothetical protein